MKFKIFLVSCLLIGSMHASEQSVLMKAFEDRSLALLLAEQPLNLENDQNPKVEAEKVANALNEKVEIEEVVNARKFLEQGILGQWADSFSHRLNFVGLCAVGLGLYFRKTGHAKAVHEIEKIKYLMGLAILGKTTFDLVQKRKNAKSIIEEVSK